MKYKKKNDNLMIIAKGQGRLDAPNPKPEGYDLWVMGDILFKRPDTDMIFEVHAKENYSEDEMEYVKFANNKGISVMMSLEYPEYPYVMAYPFKEIIEEFKADYFMTAISHMIAYAMHLGYKKIDTYGVNMAGISEEYKSARACTEYWIGRAHGKGIEVRMNGKYNRCLKTFDRRLYGYDEKFQWMPDDINDKSLYLTYGCSLSSRGQGELLRLLKEQTNSKYYNNMNYIPYRNFGNSYTDRRLIEDAISFNVDIMMEKKENPPKFTGDVAFFYMHYPDSLVVVNHSFKMIYITDDFKKIKEDWLTLSGRFNLWTSQKSKHWNSDKAHPQFDNLFPKFDLPKEEAFGAYHDWYNKKALDFRYKFPRHILIEDRDILSTEEGQKKILKFIGYKDNDMVLTI
jgi:hypothetical protein